MKIVVLDGYTENPGDLSWEGFEKLGNLVVYDRIPTDATSVIKHIGDANIVITNKTPISREVMNACPGIRYIGVLATGYNVVDIAAAQEKGIIVTNVPEYGTQAVAQFVFALLLEICHHAAHHSNAVKNGEWKRRGDFCFWDYPLIELAGKTMGIIGFGRIGQAVAKLAIAFGMKVLAYDTKQDVIHNHENIQFVSLDDLYKNSDIISLHCPLFPSTQGIINKKSIAKMKDGVIIVNTSRGLLIVEEDLKDALISGKVSYAAVDVVSKEPIEEENPLLSAPNIIITPHIAWAPKESRKRLMDMAVANLEAFINNSPINVVKV
ncbi:MAG TPA: D-2-hydroxyacid dehydrogenase [Clostridiales bacterium]|jgi:glycerate dehydrogenase|nr:D-2-hydroxyacid dehydrogenase [Clostridiales bacterium]